MPAIGFGHPLPELACTHPTRVGYTQCGSRARPLWARAWLPPRSAPGGPSHDSRLVAPAPAPLPPVPTSIRKGGTARRPTRAHRHQTAITVKGTPDPRRRAEEKRRRSSTHLGDGNAEHGDARRRHVAGRHAHRRALHHDGAALHLQGGEVPGRREDPLLVRGQDCERKRRRSSIHLAGKRKETLRVIISRREI